MKGGLERESDRSVHLVRDLADAACSPAGVNQRRPRIARFLPCQELEPASNGGGVGEHLLDGGERQERLAELDPGAGVVDRERERGGG